jgi:four helix bundle protein
MFNHRRLKCYQMSIFAAQRVPKLTARWPRGSYYLEDQFKRAVASIALNIAEGNGRTSPKERARFFSFARAVF